MSKQHKQIAKQMMQKDWASYVLLTLLSSVLLTAVSGMPTFGGLLGPLLAIVSSILIFGIEASYTRMLMVNKNGFPVLFSRDFSHFLSAQALPIFVMQCLRWIYLVLWTLCGFFPGIYKWFSYALVKYIAIDFPQMKPKEVIDYSRYLMRGNKGTLVLLYFRFIGWGILLILSLGLAYFYVKPYFELAMIDFYEACLAEKDGFYFSNQKAKTNSHHSETNEQTKGFDPHVDWDDF